MRIGSPTSWGVERGKYPFDGEWPAAAAARAGSEWFCREPCAAYNGAGEFAVCWSNEVSRKDDALSCGRSTLFVRTFHPNETSAP